MREALSIVLFFTGLIGSVVCLVLMFRGATHETTRPWAGLQQRARTWKDGTTYIQTYFSKGPAATKTTLARGPQKWGWLFLILIWAGLLMG